MNVFDAHAAQYAKAIAPYMLQIAEHQTIVRGLIECDEACEGRVPLLVIDGREITWGSLAAC